MSRDSELANVHRVMVWAGVADISLGLGLVVASLAGLLGPDMDVLAIVGGVMALVGVGIVLWARTKLSQADSRRGDLN